MTDTRNRIAKDLIDKLDYSPDHLDEGKFVLFGDELWLAIQDELVKLSSTELLAVLASADTKFGSMIGNLDTNQIHNDSTIVDVLVLMATEVIHQTMQEQLKSN